MILVENQTTEFKREYTPNVIKTIIAFANTGGGTIYLGVADDGTATGVEDMDGTMLRISNVIRDSVKPDVTLFVDYQQEQMEGVPVLLISVQKGTSSPYYLASKGIRPEGVYVRQEASSVPATESAILRMIKDTDGETYEEARSLNQDLLFEYADKEFAKRNVPFGEGQKMTLGIINADGIYTNLGLLLSDQCIHTIKLAVYEGREKTEFKDRREFFGSLLKQLNDAYEFIDRYNSVRSEIKGLYRTDMRDYPVEAVREALLNALVHREYSFRDSTLISIFDDRIEFVSIGGLVKGITFDDMMLGISVARNRNLANVFYRLMLIESYGTGIPKIIRSYAGGTVEPKIEVTDNAFKITLPNSSEAGRAFSKMELTPNEQSVMALFEVRDSIVRKDVEAVLGASQAMASRVLKGLVDKKIIKTVGGGKNTRYVRKADGDGVK